MSKPSNIISLAPKTTTALKVTLPIHQSPESSLLRLEQITGNREKGILPIIPIGKSTFLKRVANGGYPKPVRLGARTVAWRLSDIMALVDSFCGAGASL